MKQSKPAPTNRIRNWPEYTQSLRQRGSLTLWIDESALQAWRAKLGQGLHYGRPLVFSDTAILTALTVSQVFGLPLRQTQGFLRSVLLMLGHPELPVPDFTTLCRRRLAMNLPPAITKPATEPMHLVIDSTGLKVYGEGEWKVRQHGYSKRRTWKKLHLIVDAKTHKIAAATLTANDVHDGEMLPPLLAKITQPIAELAADGAYDHRKVYDVLAGRKIRALIAPRRNARIWQHGNSNGARHLRDENLRRIRKVGRKAWKVESGYHQRSLAETAMFRYKAIFGGRLRAREDHAQFIEAMICCSALNRMTDQGMPVRKHVT